MGKKSKKIESKVEEPQNQTTLFKNDGKDKTVTVDLEVKTNEQIEENYDKLQKKATTSWEEFKAIKSFKEFQTWIVKSMKSTPETCGLFCLLCFLLPFIPIGLMIVGALTIGKCPKSEFIPWYLLVTGIVYIVTFIINWLNKPKKAEDLVQCACFIQCIFLVWMLAGTIVIFINFGGASYEEMKKDDDGKETNNDKYCNKLCLEVALVYTIVKLVTVCLFYTVILVLFTYLIGAGALSNTEKDGKVQLVFDADKLDKDTQKKIDEKK